MHPAAHAQVSYAWWHPHAWPERAKIFGIFAIAFAIWGWFDVRQRGLVDPNEPGLHKTDFTVYTEAGDWTRDDVPRFWPGWLARPERPVVPTPSRPRPAGDVVERARRYLAAIPRPEIGAGSDAATLSAACRLVRGFALSEAEAESLLWEWAGGRPGWDRAWVARKVQHAARYGTEPIGGLRS